jgi:hypothetical protein
MSQKEYTRYMDKIYSDPKISELYDKITKPIERVEPAIGIQSTCEPDEKLTLQEWFIYIGNLIIEDRNKKHKYERNLPPQENRNRIQ